MFALFVLPPSYLAPSFLPHSSLDPQTTLAVAPSLFSLVAAFCFIQSPPGVCPAPSLLSSCESYLEFLFFIFPPFLSWMNPSPVRLLLLILNTTGITKCLSTAQHCTTTEYDETIYTVYIDYYKLYIYIL